MEKISHSQRGKSHSQVQAPPTLPVKSDLQSQGAWTRQNPVLLKIRPNTVNQDIFTKLYSGETRHFYSISKIKTLATVYFREFRFISDRKNKSVAKISRFTKYLLVFICREIIFLAPRCGRSQPSICSHQLMLPQLGHQGLRIPH